MTNQSSMPWLVLGLAIFLITHAVTFVPTWRKALLRRAGYWPYFGIFSFLASAGVVIAITAALQLSAEPFWQSPPWGTPIALGVLPVGLFLVASAYLPGGVRQTLRNPMLLGTVLLSGGHLVASGHQGATLVFGTFGGFAMLSLALACWSMAPAVATRPTSGWFDLGAGMLALGGVALVSVQGTLTGMPLL